MKKGDINYLVPIILAVVFIGALIYMFHDNLNPIHIFSNSVTSLINKLIPGFSEEITPTAVISEEKEEQIGEGTPIPVTVIGTTQEGYYITKQAYGEGWNFELRTVKTTTYQRSGPLGFGSVSNPEVTIILEHKKLLDILNSNELNGIIIINDRQYAHTINREDATPETPDLLWYKNAIIENGVVTSGTEISAEEVRNLKLSELYEDAK